jgi:hypothetical protein
VLGRPHLDGKGAGHAAAASTGSGTRDIHARQFVEHVARSDIGKVGRQFGLALG